MPSRLIVAASDSNADMLYATGFSVPDPFLFVEVNGRTAALLSDLEIDRGRKEAKVDVVESWSELAASIRGKKAPTFAEVTAAFLRKHKATRPLVPGDFPCGLAAALERLGVRVKPVEGSFWPEREIKTAAELRALAAASRVTETGLTRGIEILRASAIRKDRKLEWSGIVLTAERLRAEIESAMLFAGGVAVSRSIVACGEQACDPHERGHGPLKAHQLLILDIFPRVPDSGYFGDMTRTVVRGRATDPQRRMWEACLEGQRRALAAARPGAKGQRIQDDVREFFTQSGYPTRQHNGRWEGFFHGLGHGLGLDLHEAPRIAGTTLQPGQVFTVEPGIYVPGIGGVRHEDVVVITEKGHRMISRFPKELEL